MANNNIMFKKGTWSQFKKNILGIQEDGTQGASKIEKGALYLTEDEGGLYLGTSDGGIKRIQGSLVIYDEALKFKGEVVDHPPYYEDVLYFIKDSNALIRWDADKETWVLINGTAEDVTTALTNLGTQITAETTRATAAEADLLAKINANSAAIENNAKAIAANAQTITTKADKTALDAEVKARKELSTTVTNNGTAIKTLQTSLATTNENVAKAAEAAAAADAKAEARVEKSTYEQDQAALQQYKDDVASTIEGITTNASNLAVRVGSNETEIGNLKTTTTNLSTQKLSVDGSIAMDGNLKMGDHQITDLKDGKEKTDAATVGQLNTAVSGVNTKAETNKTDIANLTTRVGANEGKIAGLETTTSGLSNNKLSIDGTIAMTGDLKMGGKKITGLDDGAADDDAATVGQLNAAVAVVDGKAEQNKTNIANAVVEINNIKEDIEGLETTTTNLSTQKLSVDGSIAMSGALKMGGQKITGLDDGAADDDAATVGQLNTAVSRVNTKAETNKTNITNLTTEVNTLEEGLTNTGINVSEKTITLANNLDANKKKIVNLTAGEKDTDAATVGQVKSLIGANDAMTFRGTLGAGGTLLDLPTEKGDVYITEEGHSLNGLKPQRGDTFKVAEAKDYGTIKDARVGDLIINAGEDNEKPVWEHVTSGYEDDYNQKLRPVGNANNTVTIELTDGIGELDKNIVSSLTIKGNSANLQFTASGTDITASLKWDTF